MPAVKITEMRKRYAQQHDGGSSISIDPQEVCNHKLSIEIATASWRDEGIEIMAFFDSPDWDLKELFLDWIEKSEKSPPASLDDHNEDQNVWCDDSNPDRRHTQSAARWFISGFLHEPQVLALLQAGKIAVSGLHLLGLELPPLQRPTWGRPHTTFTVYLDDAKTVVVSFSGDAEDGAAHRPDIADAFTAIALQESKARGEKIEQLPPWRLGHSDRLRMSRALCALVYAKWLRLPVVRAVRSAGELELKVDRYALPKVLIKKARQIIKGEEAEG